MLPWWIERIAAPDRRIVVRQSGELHGRPRLDDRGGGRPDHRRAGGDRMLGHPAAGGDRREPRAVRRHDRFCLSSIARWQSFFSATSAACRSGWCSVGCWFWSPATAAAPRRSSCRSITSPTRPSRSSRRVANGEKIWQAHRSHFYQRATDRGFSVIDVVARVFAVNLALASAATRDVLKPHSRIADIAALSGGRRAGGWLAVRLGARSRRDVTAQSAAAANSLALIEAAIEDVFGNAVFQHFDRAAGDHPAARAPHAIFDQRLAAIAQCAHDLHRFARDLEARLIARGLGDCGLVGRRQASVGIERRRDRAITAHRRA